MYSFAKHEEITESVETLRPFVLPNRESLKADTVVTAAQRVVACSVRSSRSSCCFRARPYSRRHGARASRFWSRRSTHWRPSFP